MFIRPIGGFFTFLFNGYIEGVQHGGSEPIFWSRSVGQMGYPCIRGLQYEFLICKKTSPKDLHINTLYFKSIREVLNVAFERPGKALIGIGAVATAKLSGRLDVKVIREDRIINTYDGTSWKLEYSRNRAWVVWDIFRRPVIIGNGVDVPYEIARYDGIDSQHLDLEFFYAWAQFCEVQVNDGYGGYEDRCACDTIVDDFTDVFTLAHKIAAAGRAYIYWKGNILTGWIDDVVTTPIDLVTMDSMMHKTWKNSWAIKDELAGTVEVAYQDARQNYERTFASFSNADAGSYKDTVSIEGTGITTRGTAIHLANYILERTRLIRNTNSFRIHKSGFRYKLGRVIRLQSKIANWGHAFKVVSSTDNTITVDRDATDEANAGDVLHIRSYDTLTEQVVTDSYEIASVTTSIIAITESWDVTPIKNNLVAIGPVGEIKLRRIIKKHSTQDNYFDVTVETYDEDLFPCDDLDPETGLIGSYPTLRTTSNQADPGLPHTIPISDVNDLQAMSDNLAGNYYLTGKINALATVDWNGGRGFNPIGNFLSEFTGTFDGCGYTITRLFSDQISAGGKYGVGLFGYVETPAKIANVTLVDCNISGGVGVGALAGNITTGVLIQNCHSSGTISSFSTVSGATTLLYFGGLLGWIDGVNVYDCSSSCAVTNTATVSSANSFGGLIGQAGNANPTIVSNCFATGDVYVTGASTVTLIGGLIGKSAAATVTYCCAVGDVTGTDRVGGLIGWMSHTDDAVLKCYSTGDVSCVGSGADNGGGFVGRIDDGDITDCYSWGDVSNDQATGKVGGFSGYESLGSAVCANCYSVGVVSGGDVRGGFVADSQDGTFTNVFWDTETSGQAASDGGVGHVTSWMKTKSSYEDAGWDFTDVWQIKVLLVSLVRELGQVAEPVTQESVTNQILANILPSTTGSNSQHTYDVSIQELPAGSPGAWTDIITVDITTIGGNVQISFSFNTNQIINLKILRDAELVWESPVGIAADSYFSFQILDEAAAEDDHTYHLQGQTDNSGSATDVVARSLTCVEFRIEE